MRRKTLKEIAGDVLLMAGDPNGEKWDYDYTYEQINDVCLDFALRTHLIKDSITIPLETNRISYNIFQYIESNQAKKKYGFPIRLSINGVQNPAMWPTSLFEIDLFGFSQMDSYQPHTWHVDTVNPGEIVIFGMPDTEGYSYTALSTDSDTGLIRNIDVDGETIGYDADYALRGVSPTYPYSFLTVRNNDGNIIRQVVFISQENNMTVEYVGFPDYMNSPDDYPDIHHNFNAGIIAGSAAMLLEDGNDQEFAKAVNLRSEYFKWIGVCIAEQYRGTTIYDSCEPM